MKKENQKDSAEESVVSGGDDILDSVFGFGESDSEPSEEGVDASDKPQEKEPLKEDKKPKVEDKKEPKEPQEKESRKFDPFKEKDETEEGQQDKKVTEDYKNRFDSTRKEFLRASNQLANAKKVIKQLSEEGGFDEDTAEKLAKVFDFEPSESMESLSQEEESKPIKKIFRTVKSEIDNFKKYTTLEKADKYFSSFERWYYADASSEDREIADKALMRFENDPAAMTKEVARVGKNIYDSVYSKIEESGGIHSIFQKHQEVIEGKDAEIERLQKTVDKLKNKKEDEDEFLPSKGYKMNSSKASNRDGVDFDPIDSIWG